MWEQGTASSELAKHFGVTRNAIMGRLNRLRKAGFVGYKTDMPPINRVSKKTAVEKKEELRNFFQKKEEAKQYKENVTLMELRIDSCRFSVSGERAPDFRFCGKKVWGNSYCEEHYKLCYIPVNKRLRSNARPFIIEKITYDSSTKSTSSGQNS